MLWSVAKRFFSLTQLEQSTKLIMTTCFGRLIKFQEVSDNYNYTERDLDFNTFLTLANYYPLFDKTLREIEQGKSGEHTPIALPEVLTTAVFRGCLAIVSTVAQTEVRGIQAGQELSMPPGVTFKQIVLQEEYESFDEYMRKTQERS